MGFEINKVLNEKTSYIPGGDNKSKIDISSLNKKDRELLQYLLATFYDVDEYEALDANEQKRLYDDVCYMSKNKKITHEKLTEFNSVCFANAQGVKNIIKKLHSVECWDPEERHRTISALGDMGSIAKSAIPDLKEVLIKDAGMRDRAAWALTRIGHAAVPVLISLLYDKNPRVRDTAAYALGHMGLEAKVAISTLKQVANNDTDMSVCKTAQKAIDKIAKKK